MLTAMRKKFSHGATLLELVVGLAISAILITAVWTITSSSLRTVENVGGNQHTDFTAKFFIDSFVSDVESASNIGNRPAIWINGAPLPPNGVATSSSSWTISIFSVIPATSTGSTATLDQTYSQLVTYRLGPYQYDPNAITANSQRQLAFTNELQVQKSRTIWAGAVPDTGPITGPPTPSGGVQTAGGDVILTKVRSFSCTPGVTAYIGGLDCTLEMYGAYSQSAQPGQVQNKTFRFYADAKNQP